MNATQQAQAAKKLDAALQQAGISVQRLSNDATLVGQVKHKLSDVDSVTLIGTWLSRGFVVTLDGSDA